MSRQLVLMTACLAWLTAGREIVRGADEADQVRPATVHEVRIENFVFVPETVEIHVGDSVKWVNKDAAPHSATRTDSPAFDTGLLGENEESEPIEFTTASDSSGFEYFCVPHPFMKGRVIVKLASSASPHAHSAGQHHDAAASKASHPTAATHTVLIRDQQPYYEPPAVEIHVGDSVKWTNKGALVHTATRTAAPSFDTGPLRTDESATVRFDQPTSGEGIEYFCRPHPFMKARVIVKLRGSHLAGHIHAAAKGGTEKPAR